ncbi:MAG: ferrous iron transporter B, partial [Thermoplasmata archaeon]|nr:ferrous iron transporter B [Thermoplasmata archaeon]
SLEPTSRAEAVASSFMEKGDAIICVVDVTNLERHLYLALSIIECGKPTIVALNMWDEAKKKGITVDVPLLENMLGVPVVPISALHGQGIKEMLGRLKEDAVSSEPTTATAEERWKHIGNIVHKVQRVRHHHPSLGERLAEATVKPITGIPIALLVLFSMFLGIVVVGNFIIENIMDPLFYDHYGPWVVDAIGSNMAPGFMRDLLIGNPIMADGEMVWDFSQSFGLLTTGMYVPFAMVLPFVIVFYAVLSVIEDVGYLPRLAVLLDSFFHKLGLHGASVVPTLLGLGCNVPGIMATRILETKKQRFAAATLLSIAVPCAALSAMIFAVLGPMGLQYILIVYLSLLVIYVVLALVLKRFIKGQEYEFIMEIPPYRKPALTPLIKKVWWRISGFLKEAIPFMLLGTAIAVVAYNTGVMEALGDIAAPVVSGLLGLPKEAVGGLVLGMLRKDVAVGVLIPLGMTAAQLTVSVVVLSTFFPCIATFVMLFKEFGWKDFIKAVALMCLVSLIAGTVLRLALIGL